MAGRYNETRKERDSCRAEDWRNGHKKSQRSTRRGDLIPLNVVSCRQFSYTGSYMMLRSAFNSVFFPFSFLFLIFSCSLCAVCAENDNVDAAKPAGKEKEEVKEPVEYGFPGWGKSNREAIVKLTVVKVDMTMSFAKAVRYIKDREQALRIAGAFADLERVPEPEPEYNEDGFLIIKEEESIIVEPDFIIAVDQIKQRIMIYITLERGTVKLSDKGDKSGDAAGGEEAKETPSATVTLWRIRPDGMFYKFAEHTYAPMSRSRMPECIKALEALYAE